MLDKRILQAFLKDPDLRQSRQELEAALDKELDKPETEMDTDFIAEATRLLLEIRGLPAEEQVSSCTQPKELAVLPPRKKGRLWKFSLIAAVICLISVLSVATVSATVFHVDVFSNFVQVYKDHILIHFNKKEQPALPSHSSEKLEKSLRLNGFQDVLLPSALDEGYIVEDIVYDASIEGKQTADIYLHKGGVALTVSISQYDCQDLMEPVNIGDEAIQVKEIECNGVAVFLVNMKEHVDLVYSNGSTSYYVMTQYNEEQALELAQSIGAV